MRLPSGNCLPVVGWDKISTQSQSSFAYGVLLQVGTRRADGGWDVPLQIPRELPDEVRKWRKVMPPAAILVVSGGVAEPADALSLLDAGADLVLIEAGLVFHGPGLIKRCNEALISRQPGARSTLYTEDIWRRAWFWAFALGAALAIGGAGTLGLACTRVLLPYDEAYLGVSVAIIRRTLPRMFAFMAHDRATLAGTMLGLGWLYIVIAWSGIRRAVHGARTAVVTSAGAGFISFFAFFGFGYFDTLHAFVAAVLFQLTVQIMITTVGGSEEYIGLVDSEDRRLRAAQWGQLVWLVHAGGLLIAGAVILIIGMTSVFVREDLNFLCLSAAQVEGFNPRMMGVIAHDRATLGGMLLASGVGMTLPLLWCYRRGARWVWFSIFGLGFPAYGAAIGIHLWVGYNDWHHIVPALVGLCLWIAGLVLSRGYLLQKAD